jgi:hypothetical protein
MDEIMLGYDIQGRLLHNVFAVVIASCDAGRGLLKDCGRHVESGGLACFSRDEQPSVTSLSVNGS